MLKQFIAIVRALSWIVVLKAHRSFGLFFKKRSDGNHGEVPTKMCLYFLFLCAVSSFLTANSGVPVICEASTHQVAPFVRQSRRPRSRGVRVLLR